MAFLHACIFIDTSWIKQICAFDRPRATKPRAILAEMLKEAWGVYVGCDVFHLVSNTQACTHTYAQPMACAGIEENAASDLDGHQNYAPLELV